MRNTTQRLLTAVVMLAMLFTSISGFAEDEQTYYSEIITPPVVTEDEEATESGVEPVEPAQAPEDTPDEDGRYAVTFATGDDTRIQYVDAHTMVARPEDPIRDDGGHFVGWFVGDTSKLYDFSLPLERNLTLTAHFGDQYLVEFLNVRGYVAFSTLVDAGTPVVAYGTDDLGISAEKQFIHWYEAGQDPEISFDFAQDIDHNTRLAPYLKNTLLVIFVSEGTPVEPQRIDPERPITRPDDAAMIRPGYAFSHWSTEQDGASVYPFTEKETDSLTLYAVWEQLPVKYTVVYWKEAPGIDGEPALPADYIYAFNREVTDDVKAGDVISMDKAKAQKLISTSASNTDRLYIDTHFEFVQADDALTALGDGSTIVNVYYKRIYHTVTFDFKGTTANGGLGATAFFLTDGVERPLTTTASTYVMKVKLDQNLHDIWPYKVTLAQDAAGKDKAPFALWSSYYSLSRDQFSTFEETSVYGVIKGKGMNLVASYKAATHYVYRMYFVEMQEPPAELVPGKYETFEYQGVTRYYQYMPEYGTDTQQDKTETAYVGWPGRTIPGYRTANFSSKNDHVAEPIPILDSDGNHAKDSQGRLLYELHYYMDRLNYSLTLNAMGGTLPINGKESYTEASIPFDSLISNDLLVMVPTKTNATFVGWFYDQGFKEPVELDTLMPGHDVALFAKYTSSGVDVTYYETKDSATPLSTEETAPGGLVSYPADGFVVGQVYPGLGVFKGWAFDLDGIPVLFSNSMPIYSNMAVYAQWGSVPNRVTYYQDNAGTENWKEIDIEVSAEYNTLTKHLTNPPADPPLPAADYGFVGWYTNREGTGARFTGATEILGDTEVYPVFAEPMKVAAQDVYVNTNAGAISGSELVWDQMTSAQVQGQAGITTNTGHANVRVTSTGIAYTDKGNYPPLKDPADSYAVTATVKDNLGRVATQTFQLHVSDTTDPVITGLPQVFFQVGALANADQVSQAAGLTLSDDYASPAYLETRLTNDFAAGGVNLLQRGTYQMTFATQDTVDNQGSFPVDVTLWEEEVKAEPLTIQVAEAKVMNGDAYRARMQATGYYYDGSSADGTATVPITGTNFQAVRAVPGEYWVTFTTGAKTTGGNWVTVIPDSYLIRATATNGTITPAGGTMVDLGRSLSLSYTPTDGYLLDTVTVDGVALTTRPKDYTFSNVRAEHTIHVTFKPAPFALTVRHYLLGTTTPVRAATTREVAFGDSYSASADFTLANYAPVSPTSIYGVMGQGAEEIFYYTSTEEYDVSNPPEFVEEARKRTAPAIFIIYDDDIPLAGLTSRSIGDKAE